MKQIITLIRNGVTRSGKAGRYVGIADEPLLKAACESILMKRSQGVYPRAELVFTGRERRSLETASLIYPGIPAIIEDKLCAFDMGRYTGRRYFEIVEDEDFARWADNWQLLSLGEGEAPHDFYARCLLAFQKIIGETVNKGIKTAAVITHESVIIAILQRFCVPRTQYKNWKIPHGNGYLLQYDTLQKTARIKDVF